MTGGVIIARKTVERNIAYDDTRKKYYVAFNYGNDENGKQIIKRKSYNSKTEARIWMMKTLYT